MNCEVCNQKINILQKLTAKKCQICGAVIHKKCAIRILRYEDYLKNSINYIKYTCKKCSEENSLKFGSKQHCSKCKIDITVNSHVVYCENCGKIICSNCNKEIKIPERILKYDFEEYNCCDTCLEEIKQEFKHEKYILVENSYNSGYEVGRSNGYEEGYSIGYGEGYDTVYQDRSNAENED